MVIDAASVEQKDAENPEPVAVTQENAQDILNAINRLQR